MLKISAVKYFNTLPFVFGIENSGFLEDYKLELDIPSVCAEKALSGNVDICLVPVAALPKLGGYQILTDYCIGAEKQVGSVLLLSAKPIRKIKKIYMDYQSNTSNLLAKVINHNVWNINVLWEYGTPGYEKLIGGEKAGLVIGDRALELAPGFRYKYDLATEWNKFTGLPFVFAVWICTKELSPSIVNNFNSAIGWGIKHKAKAIEKCANKDLLTYYFKHCISYKFDEDKKSAMSLFLKYLNLLPR